MYLLIPSLRSKRIEFHYIRKDEILNSWFRAKILIYSQCTVKPELIGIMDAIVNAAMI